MATNLHTKLRSNAARYTPAMPAPTTEHDAILALRAADQGARMAGKDVPQLGLW